MTYYINKRVTGSFEEVTAKVIESLKKQGFGVLTEINVDDVFKKKIDIDFRKYKILGTCNPHFAHHALQMEDKIGTLLPCNVIVQEHKPNEIEVAAIDPTASMSVVENYALGEIGTVVKDKLEKVIANL